MWFKQFLTGFIIIIILRVVIKFSNSDKFDLLYTDPKSIFSYQEIISWYNDIKTETLDTAQISKLQNQITSLSNNTDNQSLKEKLLGMFNKTTAVQKYNQISHCLDMINKLDKLSSDNMVITWLDTNTNPNCTTQIKLIKNKIKTINKQYNQYQTYRAIYMSGLNSCDEIENIYNSITNFNNTVDNFWPNDCEISMPQIDLTNIWTNLKNIYSGDGVSDLFKEININNIDILTWDTLDQISGAITSQFKTRRWKITN